MKKMLFTALAVLLLLAPFLLGGCGGAKAGEGFAIYLTKNDVSPATLDMMSHVDIDDKPLISGGDIVSYHWQDHIIQLTPDAFRKLDAMQIPTSGVSFAVCVDKAVIYTGAFWASYSSQSYSGVTIMLKPTFSGENRIQIGAGYPANPFFKGDDPRSNPVIKDALEKAGKLK